MENTDAQHIPKNTTQLWHAYFNYLSVEKNLSPNTRRAYQRDLLPFFGPGHSWPERFEMLIDRLSQSRSVHAWSATTLARKMSALRSFLTYVGFTAWADKLHNPKLELPLPIYLSLAEVEALIAQAAQGRHGPRNALLIEVLYGCGLRISEALGLQWQDIHREPPLLLIRGKGDKVRFVPYGEPLHIALQTHRAHFRYKPLKKRYENYIFLSQKGTPLTRIQAYHILKQCAHRAGIRRRLSPHVLRHSFATHLVQRGMDIALIRELLGHEHLSTTERYLHVEDSDLRETYFRCHPRAQATLKSPHK
ncbi:MAG: tyrosine-type recombinase/integrase [Bacteroidia bacterium]